MDKKIEIDTGPVVSLGRTLKKLRQRIAKLTESNATNDISPSYPITDEPEGKEDVEMDENKSPETLEYLLENMNEIAAVEGHDSHSISTLNDITQQIKYHDYTSALKKINKLINITMSFDYKEFFQLYDATVETAERLKDKVCWVLLGPTGAGKSTSINLFCGSTFKKGIGGAVVVDVKAKSLRDKDIKVGEKVTESQTRYIDAVEFDLTPFEKHVQFGHQEPKHILWVDSPGFEDTSGPEVNVANGIGTVRALKKAEMVKIIITFKEAHLDYRFKAIKSISDNMSRAVDNLHHHLTVKFGSPIAAFLTKSSHGVKSAKAMFDKAHEESEEKGDSSDENTILKALLYKLGTKGPLYDIKIDTENDNNNAKTRLETIKSLVEDVAYIKRPKTAFHEFISSSSKDKLQEQVQNNLNTIQNILENDKYFNNPKYLKYIIDILNDLDKLKTIIGIAGGNVIESKLNECISIFVKKWNFKIESGSNILKDISIKQCNISLLQQKLEEFDEIKRAMIQNTKAVECSKYYTELNDIKGVNDGLNECFDEVFAIITEYLKSIENQLKTCESNKGIENDSQLKPDIDAAKSHTLSNLESPSIDFADYENDKIMFECAKKCYLIYEKYKSDESNQHINESVNQLEKQLQEVIEKIGKRALSFMDSETWQDGDKVSTLMFMFSNLSKLDNILMIKNQKNKNRLKPLFQDVTPDILPGASVQTIGNEDEEKINANDNDQSIYKSSKVENIMKILTDKLQKKTTKVIKNICKMYSLNILDVSNDKVQNKYVDVTIILKSPVNYEMESRESKLASFCAWLNELYDWLCNRNNPGLDKIETFKSLQNWIKNVRIKWIDWLCGACLVELKECNNLLDKGAASWNDVEKLLFECKSLRKVDFVQNETSQDFFKTTSEFDAHKSKLADTATELIEELNRGKDVKIGNIIKIASQLNNAGCSKESNEMKQIHNKLEQYVGILKQRTESIVLSVEMPDDLLVIQNTMKELDTLQTFGQFMDNIECVNECYTTLNKLVIDVLKRLEQKYDLSKHSTENLKILKEKLKLYHKMKSSIDERVLKDVIMNCELKRLTQLIESNNLKINQLTNRNEEIDKIMQEKCGTVTEEKKKYEEDKQRGQKILMYGTGDTFEQWLSGTDYKDLKEIEKKLAECDAKLNTICNEEQKEKEANKIEKNKLAHINNEVDKLLEVENDIIKLKGDEIVEYRTDEQVLNESIRELEKQLKSDQNYSFTQKLSLSEAYNALNFLNQCKAIKWNLKNKIEEKESDVLTIQYVHEINGKVSKYLNAYGDILEQNLNDLFQNLAVKDGANCDLGKKKYRDKIDDIIAKLSSCLREFREISNFDLQKKMEMDDEEIKKKQLRLVTCLFTNRDIQMGINQYIGSIISDHKHNILLKFGQWRVRNSAKLPLLRFICLQMSALDRFVSSSHKDDQESYYRMSAQIDGEITKSCDDNTKLIMPSFETAAWTQLKNILKELKKTADADKDGIGQKNYRDAVMQLFGLLNKLMNETKSRLLVEINTEYNINDENIMNLKGELDKVKYLVEIITDHLLEQSEKDQVENERKKLGSLLLSRIKTLKTAAIKSAKKRDFQQCEKRLQNLEKLTNSNTGFYGYEGKIDETKTDDEKGSLRDQIDAELEMILEDVKNANTSLIELTKFNPYQKLRLSYLYDQLAGSHDDEFRNTWASIEEEIQTTIQNIVSRIRERNNQLQTQFESVSEFKSEIKMTYSQQQSYFNIIDMSLSLFPKELKGFINSLLKQAKDCAEGNDLAMGEEFKQYLKQDSWNEVATNLKGFERDNPKFLRQSKTNIKTKVTNVFNEFDEIMKKKGYMGIIDKLDSYKRIGLNFTNIFNDNPPIIMGHIQTTLEQMYGRIENEFMDTCRDIRSCLNGQKEFTYLKEPFAKIIKLLQYKDKLPNQQMELKEEKEAQDRVKKTKEAKYMVQRITEESSKLYALIQKLITKLNADKNDGLDKNKHDIDKLFQVLDILQELSAAEFHSSVRELIPLIDLDEKEDITADIQNIQYDVTVKQTKDMLTQFKQDISNDGLKKEAIQQNYRKRLIYLENLSNKCKSLVKSSNKSICQKHLDLDPQEFKKKYVKPCTERMKNDIKKMKKDVLGAFSRDEFSISELQNANANIEAFYAIKNVFEKEINDEELCNDIQFSEAIEECEDKAKAKIKKITEEIEVKGKIGDENMKDYMDRCAQNLMNLEYFSHIINFKKSINENTMMQPTNELKKKSEEAISRSMRFLTNNTETKSKINNLYNNLLDKDANYGIAFTKKQPAFAAAFAEMMNQRFRELPINDIIMNLKQTEKQFKRTKLLNKMIRIDYDGIKETFEEIAKTYNDLIVSSLRNTRSFEELKRTKIKQIASDARVIAREAVSSKNSLLRDVGKFAKAVWSKVVGSTSNKDNIHSKYWTSDMRGAIPELIAHILAVWTLSTASCYYDNKSEKSLMKARNAQIVAICCVLCLDIQNSEQRELINNLVEVGTGEGKSLIIAVTSTVLALLDFDVYCACYSELLSSRDRSAFNDLFIQFNVAKHIEYHTFNKILEQMINDGGKHDVREMAKNIVLDEKMDEKMYIYETENERQKILFIDEVDKFFSTDFFGKQYTPSSVIPCKEMKNLILFVWDKYVENGSNGKLITPQLIKKSNQYNTLLSAFKSEWHALLNESVKDMVDAIRNFEDDLFKCKIDKNGRDICYKFSDSYSSKVFYGYRTLFTYLYHLHNKNIRKNNKAYVHNKLTWFLNCGSFSYSEIPNDFYAILGVTGTLNSLSKKEHEVIQNSYGVRKYVVMPSLFAKDGKLMYAQNRDISIIDVSKNNFDNELYNIIKTYENNDDDEFKRPVIVFFKDERSLYDFYDKKSDEKEDVCKQWRDSGRINKLTPDLTESEKKTGITNATQPNQITFATEEYGRGIDFQVYDKKLEKNGMHVELTYWPETLAEEIQIKGRTARQGQRGTFHIILDQSQIIDKHKNEIAITNEDITKHKDDGDVYVWLNGIRNQVFAKQYDKASYFVQQLKPVHKKSEQLAKALRTRNIQLAKKQLLHFNKGANIQSAARLSILIDATGSMSSMLTQCKSVIQKTIPELLQFLNNNKLDTDQFEIQVVAYRNYNAKVASILQSCEFTSNTSRLTTFLQSLNADYGWGDEAVEVAFAHLNKQNKKPNIIMLMADAPAQSKSEMMQKRQERRGEKYWMKQGGIFKNKLDWNEELNKFMNGNGNTSVFCFYLTNWAKQNFNQIASVAGGFNEIAGIVEEKDGKSKSMHLDINDEVKSIALLTQAIKETILLKMNNGDRALVNELREQNKGKNIPTFL